jgi:hypothetical protein
LSRDNLKYNKGAKSPRKARPKSQNSQRGSNKRTFTITSVSVGLVVLVVWVISLLFGESTDWNEVYHKEASIPYGGHVISEMLKKSSTDSAFFTIDSKITESISLDTIPDGSSYVFLGSRHFLDSSEVDFIKSFVAQGNDAYIISKRQNVTLLNELVTYDIDFIENLDGEFEFFTSPMNQFRDSTAWANISWPTDEGPDGLSEDFKMTWIVDQVPTLHSWRYFKSGIETKDGDPVLEIGELDDDNVNCIVINHGEGRFILHCTPELLSNYFMREPLAFEYANVLFKDLGDGMILWDEDNRNFQDTRGNADDFDSSYEAEEGALSFILSQPRLRAAWYIMLLAVMLYLLFGARRNQRVIPVLVKNANTSIRYSETVGQIYMQQKDHRSLANLKMKLFLAFIRDHYNIKTTANNSEEQLKLIKSIAVKSSVSMEHVERIFIQKNGIIAAAEIRVEALVRLHRHLEYFYNNCK